MIARAILPLVQFVKNKTPLDLQRFNDKFSSFTQLSGLLEEIKGRGNDEKIGAQVEDFLARSVGPTVIEATEIIPDVNDVTPDDLMFNIDSMLSNRAKRIRDIKKDFNL